MALFSRVTVWVSNQVLTAAALNGEFNNILNNAQASSWIGFSATVAQMQQQTSPGGVGTESQASSISDELQRVRYMLAYTLGKTYWYDSTGRNFGAGNLAVQTADIANFAVTRIKLAGVGQLFSASSSSFSTSGTSYANVTNLSVTIITSGRPVVLVLLPDGTTNVSYVQSQTNSVTTSSNLQFLRGGTVISKYLVGSGTIGTGGSVTTIQAPTSSFYFIDTPGAGTYTYTVQVGGGFSGTTTSVINTVLFAYEL